MKQFKEHWLYSFAMHYFTIIITKCTSGENKITVLDTKKANSNFEFKQNMFQSRIYTVKHINASLSWIKYPAKLHKRIRTKYFMAVYSVGCGLNWQKSTQTKGTGIPSRTRWNYEFLKQNTLKEINFRLWVNFGTLQNNNNLDSWLWEWK